MTARNFYIVRRVSSGISTRGPFAAPMTLEEAKAEIARLMKQYPHQEFVLLSEIGEGKTDNE